MFRQQCGGVGNQAGDSAISWKAGGALPASSRGDAQSESFGGSLGSMGRFSVRIIARGLPPSVQPLVLIGAAFMSMIGIYRRVTPTELSQLLAAPEQIEEFLYPADDSEPPPDRLLDIDKTWHAIHFLLTGTEGQGDPPACNAVLGGTPLGEVDIGYGPARYLLPAEVAAVSTLLGSIPESELRQRLDLPVMKALGIYPGAWDDADEEWGYLLPNYRELVLFFGQAARAGDAMLLYIS